MTNLSDLSLSLLAAFNATVTGINLGHGHLGSAVTFAVLTGVAMGMNRKVLESLPSINWR